VSDEVKVGIVVEDKTGPGIASAKRNIEGLGKGAASAASGFTVMEKAIIGVGAAAAGLTAAAGFGVLKMAQGALQSYAARAVARNPARFITLFLKSIFIY
jgi:hypothetical protein